MVKCEAGVFQEVPFWQKKAPCPNESKVHGSAHLSGTLPASRDCFKGIHSSFVLAIMAVPTGFVNSYFAFASFGTAGAPSIVTTAPLFPDALSGLVLVI
ncbi:hypothetical protein B4100_1487 [Heyndrickxia coagulans]|nr:hypothetical protein B4100_1487 [Heyndrickxia coagulans]